jgi:hypothetical protein
MVPFWKISNSKRLALERQHFYRGTLRKKVHRLRDAARMWHPLKFDFCRMSLTELTTMVDSVIADDRKTPESIRPIVAIGHTKELVDLKTIEAFLTYLRSRDIAIATFDDVYSRCS